MIDVYRVLHIVKWVVALLQTGFHRTVSEVLATPKLIQDSMVWRDKKHGDYSTCDLSVIAPTSPVWNLRLAMTCHVRKLPRKCTFSLIYGERIFALDVNPARKHNNRTGEVVDVTHWTTWPCEIVERDDRDQIHVQWFDEFLRRANITFHGRYDRPPYLPEQDGLFD